jgi:hypothetical protein
MIRADRNPRPSGRGGRQCPTLSLLAVAMEGGSRQARQGPEDDGELARSG